MACAALKQITVTILDQKHVRKDWLFDFDGDVFKIFFDGMVREMKKTGIALKLVRIHDAVLTVNSYADLLNAVKISFPDGGHINRCVGHIIGKSEHLDIKEDIGDAVRRIAFAPETVAPADEFRKVCHNCGCGC